MGKIFKQLGRHWAACLVVFALLAVQAYCDLSLPDYTSKIVDVGIQQGHHPARAGIAHDRRGRRSGGTVVQ